MDGSGLSVKTKLRNDCRLLADFARSIVENDLAGNDRIVRECFKGEHQVEILRLLNAFIDHLGGVGACEDLPGDCPEARDLRMYVLAALGALTRRVGDPAGFAALTFLGATEFLDALIDCPSSTFQRIANPSARAAQRKLLRLAVKIGHYQLSEPWFNSLLAKIFKGSTEEPPAPKHAEWMARECRAVEDFAHEHRRPGVDVVDEVWALNRKEYELAVRFPSVLRGYASSAELKQVFARRSLRAHNVVIH